MSGICAGRSLASRSCYDPNLTALTAPLNAVKFGRGSCRGGSWVAVVELAVVGGAFEAVVVSAVSFDHPGVCSVSSRGVGWVGDFVGGFGECGGECFRGKAPPGCDLAADGAV